MTLDRNQVLNEVKDYVFITFGLMLYTFGFTVFLLPYKIVTGGIAGLGAIVFYATSFPVQYTFFIVNAVLIVAALKILGWRFLMKTIYATFMLTFLLEVAQQALVQPDGTFHKLLGEGNDFMSLVIGCMLTGTALAIVFLNNGSTGGTDIVAASVNKYRDISLGRVLIMVDLCIIGSSLFIPSFGSVFHRCQMVVFGLCTMVIECLMLDYVMSVQRQSVQFLIFSRHYEEIARAIPRHQPQDRPQHDAARRPRLVQRQGDKGDMPAGQEAREPHHLPPHKDDRPARLREPKLSHRGVRRGLRPHKGEGRPKENERRKGFI